VSLFKQDPRLALAKTEDKIGSVQANIEALRGRRAEKLLEAEDPSEVVRLDKSIEAEQANLVILNDRVVALKEEIRRHAFEDREDKRRAAIKKLSAHLAKRETIAAKLEAAITEVGDLYDQLNAPDYAADVWPFSAPGYGFADFDRSGVTKELGWALHSLVQGHGLPMPNSLGLGVFGIKAEGIAATVRAQNQGILSRAETASIHDDILSEAV
jgi:hypothetical protein